MIRTQIKEKEFIFETTGDCFSPRFIDGGTLAMLSIAEFNPTHKILDLGCGYGVIGIVAAKFTAPECVYMSDINPGAIECAKKNAMLNGAEGVHIIESDAFNNIDEKDFDLILSNPPYHADFSTAKRFVEKGFNRLVMGGRFLMVTKRREWYKNKFISVFGGVKIHEVDGYLVFDAQKRSKSYGGRG